MRPEMRRDAISETIDGTVRSTRVAYDMMRQIYQHHTNWLIPNIYGNPWIPLMMNVCLPGSGTIYAVMNQKNDSRFINTLLALFQFFTCLIFIGWAFGIIWGFAIAERSSREIVLKAPDYKYPHDK